MAEMILRKVTVVETYIEITRKPEAPAVTPRVVEVERKPTTGQPARKGDIVEYYSQAGRRGEYRVNTVGQDGGRVELKGYNRKSGFWVDAAKCRFLRRSW